MDNHLQGLYDIYPLIYVPFWQTTPFIITVTLLIFGSMSAALWWYISRRKRRQLLFWEQALQHLNALDFTHNTPQFYERVTHILKQYLERRYGYRLAEKTDEEIAEYIHASSLPEHSRQQLNALFKSAVAYKFGKVATTSQQMLNDKHAIALFIQQTIPEQTTENRK